MSIAGNVGGVLDGANNWVIIGPNGAHFPRAMPPGHPGQFFNPLS